MHLRKPSPTSIIAVLALFFALGGTAVASRYLITSTSQIKPSVLKNLKGKVGRSGRQGPQGKQGPQGASGPQGAQGPQGASGPQGAQGPQGAPGKQGVPGPPGLVGTLQIVHGPTATNGPEEQNLQTVTCPAGLHAIGGGVRDSGGTEQTVNAMIITSTGEGNTNNAFEAWVNNNGKTADTFNVWVICANTAVTGSSF